MNSDQLKAQARKAYERGRLVAAVQYLWFVLPILVIALCTCGSAGLPIVVGCLLAFSVVTLKWRGEEYGASVMPGLLAGAVAFVIPLVLHLFEICCRGNLEIFFCAISGLIGGAILGVQIRKSKRPNQKRVLGFAILIAALTAALGCIALGIGATIGLLGTLAVAAFGLFALKARS